MSQRKAYRARGNSPAVEYLPSVHEALVTIPQQPQKYMEVGRALCPGNSCPASSDISPY